MSSVQDRRGNRRQSSEPPEGSGGVKWETAAGGQRVSSESGKNILEGVLMITAQLCKCTFCH
jgi:hypothetical protein